MVVNEYLDKKLRELNMHDEEPKICSMGHRSIKNKCTVYIHRRDEANYMNKKTTFLIALFDEF